MSRCNDARHLGEACNLFQVFDTLMENNGSQDLKVDEMKHGEESHEVMPGGMIFFCRQTCLGDGCIRSDVISCYRVHVIGRTDELAFSLSCRLENSAELY